RADAQPSVAAQEPDDRGARRRVRRGAEQGPLRAVAVRGETARAAEHAMTVATLALTSSSPDRTAGGTAGIGPKCIPPTQSSFASGAFFSRRPFSAPGLLVQEEAGKRRGRSRGMISGSSNPPVGRL